MKADEMRKAMASTKEALDKRFKEYSDEHPDLSPAEVIEYVRSCDDDKWLESVHNKIKEIADTGFYKIIISTMHCGAGASVPNPKVLAYVSKKLSEEGFTVSDIDITISTDSDSSNYSAISVSWLDQE